MEISGAPARFTPKSAGHGSNAGLKGEGMAAAGGARLCAHPALTAMAARTIAAPPPDGTRTRCSRLGRCVRLRKQCFRPRKQGIRVRKPGRAPEALGRPTRFPTRAPERSVGRPGHPAHAGSADGPRHYCHGGVCWGGSRHVPGRSPDATLQSLSWVRQSNQLRASQCDCEHGDDV